MDKDYEIKYHTEEESNWWFVSRRNAILKLMIKIDKSAKILDIGCGGGPLLLELNSIGFANTYGLDISENAIEKCRERGLDKVFVMNGHCPEFEAGSFDIIISSDSLEHLENDTQALLNWYSILKPNGLLIVFVPAFIWLWSEHDDVNHHYRRYTTGSLKTKIEHAGFSVIKESYWNFCMFFPTALFRVIQKIIKFVVTPKNTPKDQLKGFSPIINKILIKLISFENLFFVSLGFPIGVSAFIQAKKSKSLTIK